MDEQLRILQMGALLHDIGKIVRRAGRNSANHTAAGVDFITQHAAKGVLAHRAIKDIVQYHHADFIKQASQTISPLAYIVYEADNVASGIDRRLYENMQQRGDEHALLNSVFNVLHPSKHTPQTQFKALTSDIERFNMPHVQQSSASTGDYAKILATIEQHIAKSQNASVNDILLLLENTCAYIPSSAYVDRPDISLYDHLKLTSALAGCMYLYDNEHAITNPKEEYYQSNQWRDTDKFMMVSGEFSGIQDFIYNIASKSAMKSLRGRSFYLELLLEHIIDELLDNFQLSRANLLYSGGGHFYLLLPNSQRTATTIDQYKQTINDYLLSQHGTELFLSLVYQPVSADQMGNVIAQNKKSTNHLGAVFAKLSQQTALAKVNRYSCDQLAALCDSDSELNRLKSHAQECSVCKKSEKEATLAYNHKHYHVNMCNTCMSYMQLGKRISQAYHQNQDTFFVVQDNWQAGSQAIALPKINGDTAYLIAADGQQTHILQEQNQVNRIYAINRQHLGQSVYNNLWIGNYNAPPDNADQGLVEFKSLAKRAKGIPRLAVLRADIDNLGTAFQRGFIDENSKDNPYQFVSISRTVVLSRYLSDFFRKKINQIAACEQTILKQTARFEDFANFISEQANRQGRDIVIVYAGGDDLFAIGAWQDIIEFAVDFNRLFSLFSNDKMTISAGIGIFSAQYPVHQMAKLTGKLEKVAKSVPNKNSLALFDPEQTYQSNFTWQEFSDQVIDQKYSLIKQLANLGTEANHSDPTKVTLGKGTLYKLIQLIRSRLKDQQARLDIARFAYVLARINHNDKQNHNYDTLKAKLFSWIADKDHAQQLLTALTLLVYEIRED